MYCQLDEILLRTSDRFKDKIALTDKRQQLTYQELNDRVKSFADSLIQLGLPTGSRIAIYLPKQVEAVIAMFAASRAGLVFVPINPILKAAQVSYILQDCQVQLLVSSPQRVNQLQQVLSDNQFLEHLVLTEQKPIESGISSHQWSQLIEQSTVQNNLQVSRIDQDLAAILYTSGSTGQPKGVCLSHRNLIAGAQSVSQYLENTSEDKILAVLPLSFDYGLSQVTTAFLTGAELILMEYLLPRDVLRQVEKHKITGLAAVPPLWVQLAQLEWPESASKTLRYITNSGGAMPVATLQSLRQILPNTKPFLMYGLTEAFRSTYLDPAELDNRPESIGKAIPNAEVLVVRPDGTECAANEVGELVHRGVHVSLGYWNAVEKTNKRFKPISQETNYLTELAVWSGDSVKKDEQGFIYFIGRQDDMIKCSGYRISPSELEDSLYQLTGVSEVAALGLADEQLGQVIMLVIKKSSKQIDPAIDEKAIRKYCKANLPNFMQPKFVEFVEQLPRNPNGKIDRKQLMNEFKDFNQ